MQFLDVVYQIMLQFPTVFEFSSNLLVFLADHVHSCLFGNFLGNSESERQQVLNVFDSTKSVWAYVLEFKATFSNVHYSAYDQPIWPSCSMASIEIWRRFWQRWDMASHPNRLHLNPWHDDW